MKMNPETGLMLVKGACIAIGALVSPLGVGLAQWANSGSWPPNIAWVIILAGCVSSATTALLAFVSTAFTDYKSAKDIQKPVAEQTMPHGQITPLAEKPPVP